MNIDLRKFNYSNTIEIDTDVTFDESYYKDTDIRDIKDAHVSGTISINSLDELVSNLIVTGTFILPNSVTLEDISYWVEPAFENTDTSLINAFRYLMIAFTIASAYINLEYNAELLKIEIEERRILRCM